MRTRYCLSCSVVLLLSAIAFAQFNMRDMAKEGLIWQKLQSIAPRSVETFKEATAALDKGDYQNAARLYEEVFKKAPDFDPVMRRLGLSLVEIGRRQEGLALLEKAVEKNRSQLPACGSSVSGRESHFACSKPGLCRRREDRLQAGYGARHDSCKSGCQRRRRE